MNNKKLIKMKTGVERVFAFILFLVVLLNIVSCGAKKTTTNNAKSTTKEETILVNDFTKDEKTNYSIVKFGHYEQDGNKSNGAEEIEWLVLDNNGREATLISKYCLDTKQFNDEYIEVTWETCTLRTWLNNDFLENAFSTIEQESGIKLHGILGNRFFEKYRYILDFKELIAYR